MALFFLGLAIPCLINAVAEALRFAKDPNWSNSILIVYAVAFLLFVVAGAICLLFDRRLRKVAASLVEATLQDMQEVYARSARAEETYTHSDGLQPAEKEAVKRDATSDDLPKRFDALRQVKMVAEAIPPDRSRGELEEWLRADSSFRARLTGRLVRLFGFRDELLPYIEAELVEFVDARLRPLYVIEGDTYTFRGDKLHEFAIAAHELRWMIVQFENQLMAEYSGTEGNAA